ncbi:MAG: hypothetical protein AAGL66_03185 [Pseudomonadota bacterium]
MRSLRCGLASLVTLPMLFLSTVVLAQELSWPQEITSEEGTLVIYQPQPEELEGNKLRARSAISIELKDAESPIFGAMWFESRIETDHDAGTATIIDIEVTKAGWPDSRDAGEQRLMRVVESAFPVHGLEISLERLSASLETANIERKSLENLNNDPPEIVFRETLSVLLVFDGDPRFEQVEDSPYERAVNTPFLVARERRGKLYLSNGAFWYEADEPLGPWNLTDSAPEDLQRMVAQAIQDGGAAEAAPEQAPAVVVAQPRSLSPAMESPTGSLWLAGKFFT